MDRPNNSSVSIEEIAMILGSKDIEIHSLQKQLRAALIRIAELEPKLEAQPELKVVP